MKRLLIGAVLVAIGALATLAKAQEPPFPSKPIRIVAPFGAGGGGDTSLRMLGVHLSRALGQSVIIENKPGANGVIGAQDALRAAPDGHTLFYGSTTTLAANSSLMKKLPYDPTKDFVAIAQVSDIPFMLVVDPALGVKTVPALIAMAKGRAQPLTFASANHSGLVAGNAFARGAGVTLVNVPYKASPAGLTDVVAGRVTMMFVDVAAGLPLVRGGKLVAIGVTTANRSSLLPDIPAIAETLPGYEVIGWTAMAAPAGTRPEIVRRLHQEIERILVQPDVRADFAKVGFEVRTRTPAETAAFFVTERDAWAERVRAAGIEPE